MKDNMIERYKKAEMFLSPNASELVSRSNLTCTWNRDETMMIYSLDLYDGMKSYYLVDVLNGSQKEVFDHTLVLNQINNYLDERINILELSVMSLEEDYISVQVRNYKFKVKFNNKVELIEEVVTKEQIVGLSPDGSWVMFEESYNLFIKEVDTKIVKQITTDGVKGNGYGRCLPDPRDMLKYEVEDHPEDIYGFWSQDSRYFVTQKIDYLDCSHSPFIQSCPKDGSRPKVYNPVKALYGDERVPLGYITIIDIEDMSYSVIDEPVEITSWGAGTGLYPSFNKEGSGFYHLNIGRGSLTHTLKEINFESATSSVIMRKESDRKMAESFYHIMLESNMFINICDRSGWPHLYIHDLSTGKEITQLTSGHYGVRMVEYIDEKNQVIYFTAYGKEDGNPYHEKLYKICFDGTGLELLTKEKMFHQIRFSPSSKYFIDTISTVTESEKYLLKNTETAKTILELNHLDITKLQETGWYPVEEFVAKARDGETDIYCNIHRPSHFDPSMKYPIIENIYASPWGYYVPKSFNGERNTFAAYTNFINQSIAELGFIVVMIDGFGTYGRGNNFADKGVYNQVRDSGLPDHVTALKQIAKQYTYVDLDRVGIFGSSAGGYDTVNAMLRYPEIYKVGVACAGSHDYRLDPAKVHEDDSGFPNNDEIDAMSNVKNAYKLEGKLLLGHGETDPNVNVAQTMRLANALIEADKDFEMLILPNVDHGILRNKYFQRRMWDYFVRNLLGEKPPKNYRIK